MPNCIHPMLKFHQALFHLNHTAGLVFKLP